VEKLVDMPYGDLFIFYGIISDDRQTPNTKIKHPIGTAKCRIINVTKRQKLVTLFSKTSD